MNNAFYTAPSYMAGGYTVYGGYRRQRGAGMFGSFRKMMAPIGRQAFRGLKTIAKNKTVRQIAKQAAQKSAEVLSGVAVDALQGRNVGDSFKERARNAALESLGVNPPDEYAKPAPRKRAVRKLKQKKRSAPVKTIVQPPIKKRRRTQSRAALNRKNLF